MGGWFHATFVFSIPALLFYDPVLNNASYIVVGDAETRVAFGAVFEIISATAGIATAVVIFPIAKRVSETSRWATSPHASSSRRSSSWAS